MVFIIEIYNKMYFTGKPDGPSNEKYIAHYKLIYPQLWRFMVKDRLLEDAKTWRWNSVIHDRVYMLQDEEFQQFFLKNGLVQRRRTMQAPIVYLHSRFIEVFRRRVLWGASWMQ